MRRNKQRIQRFGVVSLLLCLFYTNPVRSHDPITTSVTFSKDVIRILQRNCLDCHAPGRIKSDIPLTTYEEARPWAKAIKEEVLERRMPPYQAVRGYGDFHNPYLLSQREVELLVSWIEGGAPRGDSKDLPTEIVPAWRWSLGQPQLELQAERPTQIRAGASEEEVCVKLPTHLKQAQWVKAIEFLPSNASAVLAAEIYLQRQCNANCATGEKVGEWVPGQEVTALPANAGLRVTPNACFTLKIRYKQGEEPVQDQSRLGVYFAANELAQQTQRVAIKPVPKIIPAETKTKVSASYLVRESGEAVAIRPLIFPFASAVEATAIRPDGTIEVLIVAQSYRHNWQPSYVFKQPVKLPSGTRIEVTAYVDNTEENRNLQDAPKAKKFTEPLIELTLAKPKAGAASSASE